MTVTPQILQIKDAVRHKYLYELRSGELLTGGGVYSCRKMRGKPGLPDAWSEHSWGNAWDLYYGDRPRTIVDAVVAWLKRAKADGSLPVGSIIHYGMNGSHVHIEGAPKRNPRPYTNIPPCASGVTAPDPGKDPQMVTDIQKALNDAGIPDYEGKALVVDGKWGPRTASAYAKMVLFASQMVPPGAPDYRDYEISGTITLGPIPQTATG